MSFEIIVSESTKRRVDKLYDDLKKVGPVISTVNPENSPTRRPLWLDEGALQRAQWLARKYFASLFLCHFAGLLLLVQMPTVLEPVLLVTGTHNTIARLFARYLDTFVYLKKWYESNPYDAKSEAHKSFKKVNLMHKQVYQQVNSNNNNMGSGVYLNQYDMVITQWSSIAPVILYPKQFGFHDITRQDLEDLVHYWKAIGHCLGIEDRFNVCRESLEETHYFCQLLLERDFYPVCALKVADLPETGLNMAIGLTKALAPLAPIVSLEGLMRYTYKVMQIPVYVKVSDKFGHKSIVYLVQTMFKYSFFHWFISGVLKMVLLYQSFRKTSTAKVFESMYPDINYSIGCPFKNQTSKRCQ